ncbi:contact-dependent growth inhibition system immunity protein [Streptomyces sp. CoH27]|uniref:contact-dependent growth inhibition system immunity protein n=1 Tax=Streptomyces sp. CoH27 TaxID=2875763 RepID=UPI001CD2ADDD|nr:contact-dependent growth inhibition system immunity protein [Streptomyces sp. CoH27]
MLKRQKEIHDWLTGPKQSPKEAFKVADWEWRERFPALAHFLGAYFHQDFGLEYQSHAEAVDDYLSGEPRDEVLAAASEISDFLSLNRSDDDLEEATDVLGLCIEPPDEVSLRQWLTDIQGIITHHLRTHP